MLGKKALVGKRETPRGGEDLIPTLKERSKQTQKMVERRKKELTPTLKRHEGVEEEKREMGRITNNVIGVRRV